MTPTNSSRFPTRPFALAVVLFVALAASWGMSFTAARVAESYYKHHPLFYDTLSYLNYNRSLYELIGVQGRDAVIKQDLTQGWFPARTVPLLLLKPKLMGNVTGPVWSGWPALFACLAVVGMLVLQYTGRPGLAVAVQIAALMFPGWFHPTHGWQHYWLDLVSGTWAAAAVGALLLAWRGPRHFWLALFGLLAGCAAASRYVSAVYLLVVAGPLLVAAMWQWRRNGESWKKAVVLPLLTTSGALLVLAVPYLATRFSYTYYYYTKTGYGYQGIPHSIVQAFSSLAEYLGIFPLIFVILWICAAWIWRRHVSSPAEVHPWVALWVFLIIPSALGFGGQMGEARHAVLFQVPMAGIAMACVAGILCTKVFPRAIPIAGALALMASGGLGTVRHYFIASNVASVPPEMQVARQTFLDTLTDLMSKDDRSLVYAPVFDYANDRLRLHSFLRNRYSPTFVEGFSFINQEVNWVGWMGLQPEEIPARYYREISQRADRILAFSTVEASQQKWPSDFGYFWNPLTAAIAAEVTSQCLTSGDWVPIRQWEETTYGPITLFERTKPRDTKIDTGSPTTQ